MKKQIITTGLLLACASFGFGQSWSTGTDIYNTNTGNVGVGNSSPTFKLDVQTNQINGGIRIRQTSSSAGAAALWLDGSYTGVNGRLWGILSTGQGNASPEGPGNFNIVDYTYGSRLFIQGGSTGGQVGIGTITPADRLHVIGGIRSYKDGSGSISPQLYLGNAGNNRAFSFQLNAAGNCMDLWAYNGSSWLNQFSFSNGGSLGIGTTNITAKLTVNGNCLIGDPAQVTLPSGYKLYVQTGILTEKVKVALTTSQTDWADYVFDKTYTLKTIEEVQNYIVENKHLPGVPSAEELVEQGGIDLAKMDCKLMEKIEELTLYIIQLNEKNKELTERLAKLEASK